MENNLSYLRDNYPALFIAWEKVQMDQPVSDFEFSSAQRIDTMLTTMEKYGENRWWLGDDLDRMAYYQFYEQILLVDFELFETALSDLLGYSVATVDFYRNYYKIESDLAEANQIYGFA